jgi:ferrous iron transport protein B
VGNIISVPIEYWHYDGMANDSSADGLDMGQLIVASVVLTMYFPCVATFVVLFKELGAGDLIKATTIMVGSALLVGGVLNALL